MSVRFSLFVHFDRIAHCRPRSLLCKLLLVVQIVFSSFVNVFTVHLHILFWFLLLALVDFTCIYFAWCVSLLWFRFECTDNRRFFNRHSMHVFVFGEPTFFNWTVSAVCSVKICWSDADPLSLRFKKIVIFWTILPLLLEYKYTIWNKQARRKSVRTFMFQQNKNEGFGWSIR